jgi:acyl-coenzyme A synthetase/AMP-(fatty) acid ligase
MINLMESTNCQTLLSSEDKLQRWDALGSRIGNRRVFTVPSFEYFFNDTPVERYPFVKTWEEIQHDPAFILHTSGSTGNIALSISMFEMG